MLEKIVILFEELVKQRMEFSMLFPVHNNIHSCDVSALSVINAY